mgnify:CR=1 FL=1
MVLYYNQVSVPMSDKSDPSLLLLDSDMSDKSDQSLLLASDLQKSPSKIYTVDTPKMEIYQENRGLLESLSEQLFGDTLEMQTVILEENFSNLSMDEKMNYIFKSNIIQGRVVSKYLRLILFILMLMVFKLYF